MMPLLTPAANGGGAVLSSATHCSLKFVHPVPPLFTKRRPTLSASRLLKPLILANATESSGSASTKPTTTTSSSSVPFDDQGTGPNPISFVGQENVPLEGVIQFEKPESASLLAKWGLVAVLAGGDVAALLLFAAIGRISHGLSVLDFETFKTADPFIAGWFLSAYFLGGYSKEGRGKNGLQKAVIAAAKSWSLGIPKGDVHADLLSAVQSILNSGLLLGLIIRALAVGHQPPTNFILVTMGSTAVLLIGWRALFFSIFPSDKGKKNDMYKRGSPFELFELLTSLVRRW